MSDKVKTYKDGVRETLRRLERELGGMDSLPGWKISEFIAEVEADLEKPFVAVGAPVSDGAMHHTLTLSPRRSAIQRLTVLDIFTDEEGPKLGLGYPGGEVLLTPPVSMRLSKPDGSALAVGDDVEIVVTLS